MDIKTESASSDIVKNLEGANYKVTSINKKEVKRNPSPPFTTSTLQQEAARKFGMSAKQTMVIAQQLYEGVTLGTEGQTGLITYMRTDSLNLAASALSQAQEIITAQFGKEFGLDTPRYFSTKN
jgi:DNA topoisomerase-1